MDGWFVRVRPERPKDESAFLGGRTAASVGDRPLDHVLELELAP